MDERMKHTIMSGNDDSNNIGSTLINGDKIECNYLNKNQIANGKTNIGDSNTVFTDTVINKHLTVGSVSEVTTAKIDASEFVIPDDSITMGGRIVSGTLNAKDFDDMPRDKPRKKKPSKDDIKHDNKLETPCEGGTSIQEQYREHGKRKDKFEEAYKTGNVEAFHKESIGVTATHIDPFKNTAGPVKQYDATDMMNEAIEANIATTGITNASIGSIKLSEAYIQDAKIGTIPIDAKIGNPLLTEKEKISHKDLSASSIEHMRLRSKAEQDKMMMNPPRTIFDTATQLSNEERARHNREMDEIIKAANITAKATKAGGYSVSDVIGGPTGSASIGGSKRNTQDMINKPEHYHKGGIDVYEIMQAKYSEESYRGFCLGNVTKYVLRHDLKGGIQDLEKAQFNLERLIESYKGIKYVPAYKKEGF